MGIDISREVIIEMYSGGLSIMEIMKYYNLCYEDVYEVVPEWLRDRKWAYIRKYGYKNWRKKV
jgi:uncharacterized protein (DUF433 family)